MSKADIVTLLRAADPDEIWTGRGGLFDRAADEIVRLRDEVASLRADVDGAAHNRIFDRRDGYYEGVEDGKRD